MDEINTEIELIKLMRNQLYEDLTVKVEKLNQYQELVMSKYMKKELNERQYKTLMAGILVEAKKNKHIAKEIHDKLDYILDL